MKCYIFLEKESLKQMQSVFTDFDKFKPNLPMTPVNPQNVAHF